MAPPETVAYVEGDSGRVPGQGGGTGADDGGAVARDRKR